MAGGQRHDDAADDDGFELRVAGGDVRVVQVEGAGCHFCGCLGCVSLSVGVIVERSVVCLGWAVELWVLSDIPEVKCGVEGVRFNARLKGTAK